MPRPWKIIFGAVIVGIAAYGIYRFHEHLRIQKQIRDSAAQVVIPKVDAGSVSETGVVVGRYSGIWLRRWILNWDIEVAETKTHYTVEYNSGYQDFNVGDKVTIIHAINAPGAFPRFVMQGGYRVRDYSGFLVDASHVAAVEAYDKYGIVSQWKGR
jgi:hypothetical protein